MLAGHDYTEDWIINLIKNQYNKNELIIVNSKKVDNKITIDAKIRFYDNLFDRMG